MARDTAALLLVAALAVLALAAGAANLQALGDVDAPTVGGETVEQSTTSESGTGGVDRATPPPAESEGCDGCPNAAWPSLIDRLDGPPGGPLLATLGAVALAVLLTVHVFRRPGGARAAPADSGSDGRATVPERAAGRTATVPSSPPTNDVYRAWRDLRRAVADRAADDVAALTPGEVAAAARDAGVDGDVVTEITGLFERVRYGGRPPTDERERRAAEARVRVAAGARDGDGQDWPARTAGGQTGEGCEDGAPTRSEGASDGGDRP